MAKCKVLVDMLVDYKDKYYDENKITVNDLGCELFFLDYKKQLEFKKEYVTKLFKKKEFDININKIHPSPIQNEYRNKMEYSFGDMSLNGELNLGLHVPGRYYDIQSNSNLSMVDDDFNTIVKEVELYCRKKGYKKFYKKDGTGLLRNLIVRKGKFTNEILIGISTSCESFDKEDFVSFLLSLNLNAKIVGILHLKNNSVADVVKQGEDDEILYGKDYYNEKILGLNFKISFFSFFQTNSACTEVLYTKVKEIVNTLKPKKALDLFCGTGTISQVLSNEVKELIGIEIIEDAVIMANENAKTNNINNCSYIAGDVFKVLKDKSNSNFNSDLIIVDPPRSGISKKALEKIIALDVKNILYVSCNPRTLAIDYEILNEAGYEIQNIELVDMYPHTKHVESVVLMTRK